MIRFFVRLTEQEADEFAEMARAMNLSRENLAKRLIKQAISARRHAKTAAPSHERTANDGNL